MTELEKFQELKLKVLLKYQEQYPYFQGNWKSFSSQDIQNLISFIETNCKQSISEKWIYTHLKPESNSKIPRKDMLNILSEFVGFSGWDEFVFEANETVAVIRPKKNNKAIWIVPIVFILGILFWYFQFYKNRLPVLKTVEIKNQFTNETIKSNEVKVFQVQDSIKKELQVKEGKVKIATNKNTKLLIQSPFYKTKTIAINTTDTYFNASSIIDLKPDDYAMMLKAFMVSDIKDWQTRKEQLKKILSDDLEVMVMLKDNLGAEYYDKNEFAQKLIIPTLSVKKMKIIEIEKDNNQKIKFIRITQE